MYVNFKDIKELVTKETGAENPGIFVEYMGKCFEPEEVYIDDDGDIIILI